MALARVAGRVRVLPRGGEGARDARARAKGCHNRDGKATEAAPGHEHEHEHDTRRGVLLRGGLALGSGLALATGPLGEARAEGKGLYALSAKMYGEEVPLDRQLYETYNKDGFELIGFSCNQFGGQAPGTSQEEREFAWRKFGFEFPVFDKVDVNGFGAHPVYQLLRRDQPTSVPSGGTRPQKKGELEWNYVKFLVNREGKAVKRYKPSFDPLDFEKDLQLVLKGRDPLPEECFLHPGRLVCKVDDQIA